MTERVEAKLDPVVFGLAQVREELVEHRAAITSLSRRLGETDGRITQQGQRIEPIAEHVSGLRFFFKTLAAAVAAIATLLTILKLSGALK